MVNFVPYFNADLKEIWNFIKSHNFLHNVNPTPIPPELIVSLNLKLSNTVNNYFACYGAIPIPESSTSNSILEASFYITTYALRVINPC